MMPRDLSPDDRKTLLNLARAALDARLRDLPPPELDVDDGPLNEYRGAFVTLSIEGRLRGCIGHVEGIQPLWKTVRDNAIAAAFRDPRFPPLDAGEMLRVDIEISVLSPLVRLDDPSEVVVGRDGLMLECGHRRGLLLPQVAERYGWDEETFLDHTCRKAGLEPGCWRSPDASVYAFTAEHFSEAQLDIVP